MIAISTQISSKSPITGADGNVEFFLWFRRGAPLASAEKVHAVVAGASGGAEEGSA